MARINSVVQWSIEAQTKNVALLDDFRKRVDNIGLAANRSVGGIGAMTTGLAGMSRGLGALGIGLSVAGVVRYAGSVVELAGKLNDASAATTVAATKLDQYRQAGEQVGVSFETITGGLGKLNKSIAAAASGNEEAAKAFADLGIAVKNQDGSIRSTSDVFEELAQKIRAAPDDAAIFEQGTKIFGRGFASLLPLLEEGDEGMKKFRSRFSAEGIKELDAFGDNITNIGEGFGFLAAKILENVIPSINGFTNSIAISREAVQNFLNTNNTLEAVLDDIAAAYIRVASAAEVLWNAVSKPFTGNYKPVEDFFRIQKQQEEALKRLKETRTFNNLNLDISNQKDPSAKPGVKSPVIPRPDLSLIADRQIAQQEELAKQQEEYARERQRQQEEQARMERQMAEERQREAERQKSVLMDFSRQNQDRLDALNLELDLVGKTYKEQQKINLLREIDNETRQKGLDLTEANKAKLEAESEATKQRVSKMLDELNAKRESFSTGLQEGIGDYLTDVADKATATRQLVNDALYGIEDAFVQLATTGKLSFKNLADSIIADIARIAVRQAITGPLASALAGAFSGGGSGGVGSYFAGLAGSGRAMSPSGFVSVTPNAMGGIMTSNGPMSLNHYSNGGIANRPQLALFGEGRTPEAFVPLPDGRRIPVAMQGGGGQAPVMITMNINTPDAGSFKASQGQINAALRRAVLAGARNI